MALTYVHGSLRNTRVTADHIAFLCICSILTAAIVVNFVVQLFYVIAYVSDCGKATKLLWMAGLYPVTAIVSCIGLFAPKTMALSDMCTLLYFSRTLFVFVDYVIQCFGGLEKMHVCLRDQTIRLDTPPCCCCCKCLPNVKPTKRYIRILAMLTYQNAIVRPLTFYISAAILIDALKNIPYTQRNPFAPYSVVINTVSSLLAFYGVSIYTRAAAEPLKRFCIRPLKSLIQILIVLYSLQSPLADLFATKVFKCDQVLPAQARSDFWLHVVLIFECFLLAVLSSLLLRPEKNAVFDRYPASTVFAQQTGQHPRPAPGFKRCSIPVITLDRDRSV